MNMHVVKIKLGFSNAYLVTGDRTILVDTGMPGDENKILRAIARAGIRLDEITLILHTHGHVDHAGSTDALRQHLGVPTAVHAADAEMLRTGRMRALTPLRLESHLVKPFIRSDFPPVAPDLLIDERFDLSAYGVEGRVLHTPGHTAGSISLFLPNGEAIIGDTMMGGMLGGNLFGTRPNFHYFAEDIDALHRSIQSTISQAPERLYVGHGGPLNLGDVKKHFKSLEK